jgi:hypothetical protein
MKRMITCMMLAVALLVSGALVAHQVSVGIAYADGDGGD